MPTDKDIIEGNKLLWAFMGGKWQPTENAGVNGMKSYEPIHNTYEECQKACDEINRLKSGSPRKIIHAVPSPAKNTIDRELKYHSSWNWLVPVCQKIKMIRPKKVYIPTYMNSLLMQLWNLIYRNCF